MQGDDRAWWLRHPYHLHFCSKPPAANELLHRFLMRLAHDCFGNSNVMLTGEQFWFEDADGRVVFLVNFEADTNDQWTLYNVCLHPSLQGLGLSIAFLRAVVTHFARLHPHALRLRLAVYADNVAAIHLYRRAGFDFCGTTRRQANKDIFDMERDV